MIVNERIENGIIIKEITTDLSDMATEQQRTQWLGVCELCEFKDGEICTYVHCKCLIETLMMLNTSKCPINKW